MAKNRVQFLCNHCGSVHPKWMGKCPDCGTWDSLEEYKAPTPDAHQATRVGSSAHTGDIANAGEPIAVADIDQADSPRMPTGIGEFDRILGGGIVPGSAVLVGGDPGIGKSTLLLQVANQLAAASAPSSATPLSPSPGTPGEGRGEGPRSPILYVTSEESARQTALRASRLGVRSPNLLVLAETNVERIINQIHQRRPAVVIVDSIQMIYKPDLPAAPGSVTQLRGCCMDLVYLAKATGIAVLFVGHVTKPARWPGRRSSSTSWIRWFTLREIASIPIASYVASRTASAQHTRWACSR